MGALLFAVAGQAAKAQDYQALVLARDAERIANEEAARRMDVALANERSREQAKGQAERAISDLAALNGRTVVVNAVLPLGAPLAFVSIPDSILADSNAKVRAAAVNRR